MIASPDAQRSFPLRRVLAIGEIPKSRLLLAVCLSAAAVLAGAALLGTSGFLISKAALQPPILTLTMAIVGVRAFGVARAVLRYYERVVSHSVALESLGRLRVAFFAKLIPLVPGAVQTGLKGASDLLSGFVADVESMRDLYVRVLIPPPAAAIAALTVIAACLLILPAAAAVLCAGILLSAVLAPWWSARIVRNAARGQADSRSELTARFVDAVDGAPELSINGAATRQADAVRESGRALGRQQLRDAIAAGSATAVTSLIGGLTVVAVLAVAVSGADSGKLDGVLIAVLLFLAMGVFEAVNQLAPAAQSAEHTRAAADRIGAVLDHPVPIVESDRPAAPPTDGTLELRDVSFAYATDQPELLSHASLTIRPGERVALIGPSGSGKSTIANLLVRFLDPTAGAVTLGGVDAREVDSGELRRAVRLEGQSGFLFATTIRENLRIGDPEAGDAALIAALRRVGLGPWFDELPDGLGTDVGEQGSQLSGGQRQRIAFARGLLAKSRFLIFDEPTAQLDKDNARSLIDAIVDDSPAETGVLVITHDDRALERFDRVVRLQGGRVEQYP